MINKTHEATDWVPVPYMKGHGGGYYIGDCSASGRDLPRGIVNRDFSHVWSYYGGGNGYGQGEPTGEGG